MEERITELELKFTEQQATLQTLSDTLYAQGKTLDLLEAQVRRLMKRVEAEPSFVEGQGDEKPPHY